MVRPGKLTAVVVGLMVVAWPWAGVAQDRTGNAKAIEGLWSGSWGGGEQNGAVFQPVIAELLVEGDKVEITGLPDVSRLTGTIRLDTSAKRIRITPATAADGPATPKAIEYAYELKGDRLTLIAGDKLLIALQKLHVVEKPLANVQAELVASAGISDEGNLLVTRFTVLRTGRTATTRYRPEKQLLSTKQATVFLVQETGLKRVTIADARQLVREAPPVVVSYRQDESPSPSQSNALWKEMGSPLPDSEAVEQTFAKLLRPGTLVFVLSLRENVPRP